MGRLHVRYLKDLWVEWLTGIGYINLELRRRFGIKMESSMLKAQVNEQYKLYLPRSTYEENRGQEGSSGTSIFVGWHAL